jgi:hypothetical protein
VQSGVIFCRFMDSFLPVVLLMAESLPKGWSKHWSNTWKVGIMYNLIQHVCVYILCLHILVIRLTRLPAVILIFVGSLHNRSITTSIPRLTNHNGICRHQIMIQIQRMKQMQGKESLAMFPILLSVEALSTSIHADFILKFYYLVASGNISAVTHART